MKSITELLCWTKDGLWLGLVLFTVGIAFGSGLIFGLLTAAFLWVAYKLSGAPLIMGIAPFGWFIASLYLYGQTNFYAVFCFVYFGFVVTCLLLISFVVGTEEWTGHLEYFTSVLAMHQMLAVTGQLYKQDAAVRSAYRRAEFFRLAGYTISLVIIGVLVYFSGLF